MENPKKHHLDRRATALAYALASTADELLNTTETAEWLGYSPAWLEIGRSKGYGPPFIRLSPRRVRYRRGTVVGWLLERQHRSTAEYGPVLPRNARLTNEPVHPIRAATRE